MRLPTFLQEPGPDVAVDLAPGRVIAARVNGRGADLVVGSHAVEPLPEGAITPQLGAPNMHDVGLVGQAVARAFAALGARPRRVALVVPDAIARVSLLKFAQLPPRADDVDELVRWQLKKAAPFPVEQAVVTHTEGARLADGQELVVTMARRDVVEQYERACELAGAHAGLVDLATFSAVNAVLAGPGTPSGDWLLVHAAPGAVSLAVVRGGAVIFFRSRPDDAEGSVTDSVHQAAMYYEDRLEGRGFTEVRLAGASAAGPDGDALRRGIEDRLKLKVTVMHVHAPLLGVLARERRVA
jgi:type IV pilus assembly protein PilM